MNIQESINRVDSVKPNQYSIEDKVRWLSYLDGSIQKEIHEKYEQTEEEETQEAFTGYSPDRLTDKLLVPFPHDELYVAYLKAKIDEENGDTAQYNNSAATFNGMLQDYQKYYNRTHMPKQTPFRILRRV
ncbi:MAG: hypothetical protein J6K15_06315 [Lachnospiraceae bacterium]|nr:hypothetical protein [Lachnospiraceae bacterium]